MTKEIHSLKQGLMVIQANATHLAERPTVDPEIKAQLQALQGDLNEAYIAVQKLMLRYFRQ